MVLSIYVSCSHTETTTSTDSDGNSTTSTKTVVTYTETIPFEYGACVDKSAHRIDVGNFSVCRLDSMEVHEWGDPVAAQRFQVRHSKAYEDNKHRDTSCSVTDSFSVPGMEGHLLIMCGTGSTMKYYSWPWYILSFLTGTIGLYTYWFKNSAGYAKLDIKKVLCTQEVTDNEDEEIVAVAVPSAAVAMAVAVPPPQVAQWVERPSDPSTPPPPPNPFGRQHSALFEGDLSDSQYIECIHCKERKVMKGFSFCGACGKSQK